MAVTAENGPLGHPGDGVPLLDGHGLLLGALHAYLLCLRAVGGHVFVDHLACDLVEETEPLKSKSSQHRLLSGGLLTFFTTMLPCWSV